VGLAPSCDRYGLVPNSMHRRPGGAQVELAPESERPVNLEKLTDEELIQLLPQEEAEALEEDELTAEESREGKWREAVAKLTVQERQTIEELWRRYSKTVERYLKYRVYSAGSTLCPPQEPDKKHFVTMCVHETYLKFLTGVRRRAIKKTFEAYVFWTTLNAAIDLRRRIAKKRGSTKRDGKKKKPKKPPVEMVPLGDRDTIQGEGRGPDELAVLAQLRDVLDNYAAKSPANALSIKLGRLRRRDNMTWQEVLAAIEKLFPAAVSGSTPGARMKKLRDKEEHDRNDLFPLLREHDIKNPSLLDALFEL
jgi:DNA-directed RNA polymerase specialized sigma24 family protein